MNWAKATRTFALSVSLLAGGCIPMSQHQGSDLSKLQEFQIVKEKTTEKELVDHFGSPMNTMSRSDGSKMLIWNDTRGTTTTNVMAGIAPVPGLSTTDVHSTTKTLSATVLNGIVIDYTVSEGNRNATY